MFILPLQVNDTQYSLYVVLEDENIERIKAYDPAEVRTGSMPELWRSLQLKDMVILYANPKEAKECLVMCQSGQPMEALRKLARGFRYRPDLGDHDDAYLSLKKT